MADTKRYKVKYAWRDDGQGNRTNKKHERELELTDVQAERFRAAVDEDTSNVASVEEVGA